ncbi:MAG: M16 family metallopeptidase [Rhodothermales bacterium]
MMASLRLPLLLVFFLVFAAPVRSQDRIPLDPAITTGTLDNGLSYMIRANDTPDNRAELRLVLNAGSILEDDDQLGLAHFVEHMAFNGTASFEEQALVEYLESIGMRFGADINAYTSFDETVYMLEVPTDDAQTLDTGLRILREWAGSIAFDPEEIDKERGVVIEEWRLRQGGANRIVSRQYPVLLNGSRYPERLPIGTEENLRTFDHESLLRYYTDWYRPDLMTVIAVGDFDAQAIESRVQELFADLVNPELARERVYFDVPDHTESLISIESDPEAGFASVELLFKHDNGDEGTVQQYTEDLKRSLFASMLNRRLGERTQDADPPFIGAGGGDGSLVRTKSAFSLSASVQDGQYLRALDAMLIEAERVRQHGFTASEFDRARQARLRRMEVAWNERDNQRSASLADEYRRHVLSGESVPGIDAEFRLLQRVLPAISLEDVNALVPVLMTQANQVVMISGPGNIDQPMPDRTDVESVMERVSGIELAPYDDGNQDAPLLAELPESGSVIEEDYRDNIDLTTWTLSNGARVVMKPTDFKADEVLLSAWSPGGASLAADSMYMSASLTTNIIGGSGVGNFNAVDLSKKLSGQVARIRPYIGNLEEGFSGSASPADLETLFQLAYLYGTAPRADSTVFASFLTRMNSMLSTLQTNPQSAFGDTLNVTLNDYHYRARPMSAEVLGEADLAQMQAFYAERFADFSDFTFLIVGTFQPDDLRPLVEQYLATLPSTGRKETWRDVGMRTPEGAIEKEIRRGIEPRSQVGIVFSGDMEWTMESRRALNMLRETLDTRLREVLREDLGGTYGVSVQASLRDQPYEHYQFAIVFGCDPERVDELVSKVWETIESFHEEGPEDVHLANAREQVFRSWETGMEENGFWLSTLEFYLARGMDPARILINPAKALEEVSPADVANMARKVLRKDQYVRVTLYPEASDS